MFYSKHWLCFAIALVGVCLLSALNQPKAAFADTITVTSNITTNTTWTNGNVVVVELD